MFDIKLSESGEVVLSGRFDAAQVEKAKAVLARTLKPSPDLYNSSATKLHLAGVLLERAWTTLST